jgi:hypothetical protein
MTVARWTGTALAMAGTAWLLAALGPRAEQVRQAAVDPQALVDSTGPDALLVVAAAAAGWLVWAWGALGLLLTALSAIPGTGGRLAAALLLVVLPAGARRAAAMAVGQSLVTGAPALSSAAAATANAGAPASTAPGPLAVAATDRTTTGLAAADWPVDLPVGQDVGAPAAPGTEGVPDWPDAAPDGVPVPGRAATAHVVLRGDCLWDIAAAWLAPTRPGAPPSDADVARAVHAWWQANAAVIGPDPDLLLPGQVLVPPW